MDLNKRIYKKEQLKRRWMLTIFSSKWFSFPWTYKMRIKAYRKYFKIGNNFAIGHNVWITRTHGLGGTISIGSNVTLANHAFIDYSGEVIIKDGVRIGAGVKIESHYRDLEAYDQGKDVNIPVKLVIEDRVFIGVNAVIIPPCTYIGKNSRIGAGAVVVKDVPDNVVVVGVPAKIVKHLDTNSEIEEK